MSRYKCPECGQTEEFGCCIVAEGKVSGDGEIDNPMFADFEIDDQRDMECWQCGFSGGTSKFDEFHKEALRMIKASHTLEENKNA